MRDIKAHTGLRGIAAMAVFLGHAQFDQLWPGRPWLGMIYSFFYWQNPAVDLFFMLSGFILNYVYLKERTLEWRDFFAARFARICPLYYAGLAAVLCMNILSIRTGHPDNGDLNPALLARNIAMVQEWPVFGFVPSINIPSWSISVEMFLYVLAFPLFAYLVAHRRIPRWVSFGGVILGIIVSGTFSQDNPFRPIFQHAGLMRGIADFAAGFLICELLHPSAFSRFSIFTEALVVLCALVFIPFPFIHFLLPIAFAALIAVTYPPASRLGGLLGSPLFNYLGVLSYSIYIWQYPVLKACSLAFAVRHMGAQGLDTTMTPMHKLLYCIGTPIVLFVLANISYYGFESPLRRLFRRPFRDWFRPDRIS